MQPATSSERDPAAARLDRATENELYALYRAYFSEAETKRNWNLWEDIPWDHARPGPPAPLVEAVMETLRAEIFLPDYSRHSLRVLRASRGRTWFMTRWSYEESKHQIALCEWLMAAGAATEPELRDLTDDLLAQNAWQPPDEDGVAFVVDALLYELREIERYSNLRSLAADAKDDALCAVVDRVLADERAQRTFFAQTLAIISRKYGEQVAAAVARVADLQPDPAKAKQEMEAALARA